MADIIQEIRDALQSQEMLGELIGYCVAREETFWQVTQRLLGMEMDPTYTAIRELIVKILDEEAQMREPRG